MQVENVRVAKMLGGSLMQSEVIKGMVLTKCVVDEVNHLPD